MAASDPGPEPETEADAVHEEPELQRTIGFVGALSIGTGTMIGAGVFVFPGLAVGLAFACAFYLVGLAFACAFYLVGFGEYAAAVLGEVGLSLGSTTIGPVSIVGLLGIGAAVLLPNPTPPIERVLVAVQSGVTVPSVASMVASLVEPTDATVSLYYAATPEEDAESVRRAFSRVTTVLEDAGIAPVRITRAIERTERPLERLIAAANDHDLLVVAEAEPKVDDWIFGDRPSRIADRTLIPVLVVRKPSDAESVIRDPPDTVSNQQI